MSPSDVRTQEPYAPRQRNSDALAVLESEAGRRLMGYLQAAYGGTTIHDQPHIMAYNEGMRAILVSLNLWAEAAKNPEGVNRLVVQTEAEGRDAGTRTGR